MGIVMVEMGGVCWRSGVQDARDELKYGNEYSQYVPAHVASVARAQLFIW